MPRLFVAIALPEAIKTRLASLRASEAPARWTKPEQMHLTLRFIGDVAEERVAEIAASLEKVAQPAFDLRVQGVGCFPSLRRPRVMWAGIGGDVNAMKRVQAGVERQVVAARVPPEPQAYVPHVTLARLPRPDARWAGRFIEQHADLASEPFRVDAFYLYQSELRPEGAVHTVVHRIALRANESSSVAGRGEDGPCP